MKIARLFWALFSLFGLAGCVQSHHAPPTVYYSPPPPPPPPTSDRPEQRVYPGPPPSAPPAPAVSSKDLAVAESVGNLLKENSSIASDNVLATVDHGVVTLRGSVPAEHDRIELGERISKIPGVERVDNQLEISGER